MSKKQVVMIAFFTNLVVIAVIAVFAWLTGIAGASPLRQAASVPHVINYQGRLTDAAGNPLTGSYAITFALYDVSSGGAALWTENQSVDVAAGVFNVLLGASAPIPGAVFDNQSLYLGVRVGGDDEMTPRRRVVSAGYAYRAEEASLATTATHADSADNALAAGNADTVDNKHASEFAAVSHGHAALNASDGDPQNAITVDADGNVRVGVGNPPGARLLVEMDTLGATDLIEPLRLFESDGPYTPQFGGLRVRYDGNTGEVRFEATRGGYWYGDNGGKFLSFYTNPDRDSIPYERMRITKNGYIGIGTANPTAALDVQGNFHVSGTKSAVVDTEDFGRRTLYAVEAPDVRFTDEGLAHVHDGMARVDLDPVFLATIEGPFLVHVTPYGDASLYVAEIGATYFVVRVREGNPDAPFAWRLSAYRKGYAQVRLEPVNPPTLRTAADPR